MLFLYHYIIPSCQIRKLLRKDLLPKMIINIRKSGLCVARYNPSEINHGLLRAQ